MSKTVYRKSEEERGRRENGRREYTYLKGMMQEAQVSITYSDHLERVIREHVIRVMLVPESMPL